MAKIKLGPVPSMFTRDPEAYGWFQALKSLVLGEGGIDPEQIDGTGLAHNALAGVDKVTGASDETYHVSQADWNVVLLGAGVANNLLPRVVALESAVTTMQGQIATMQGQISALQTEQAQQRTELDDHEARLVAGGL